MSRTLEQIEQAAQEARNLGADVIAISADIADADDVERMAAQTLDRYSRIDILVNNAAVLGPVGPLQTNDMRQWADAMRINVTGLVMCCHAVLPAMIEQGGGKIINLSGAGVAQPSETLSAYGTSKAAVIRFTETLAIEMRPHSIFVNALGPGQIDTSLLDPMASDESLVAPVMQSHVRNTKSGRGASLENAAALAVWLSSSDSDGLSGRLISSTQDDWRTLASRIPEIMESDKYTLRFVS